MSSSATDIVSLRSARETLFVGPLSAFPVQARRVLLRDRLSLRDALAASLSRPGAEERVRPFLRRWGIDTAAVRAAGRGELAEVLARAAGSGVIAVALAADPVVAFSKMTEDLDARMAQEGTADDFPGRLRVVVRLVPAHLAGTVRQEFEALAAGDERALLAGLAAMTLPGVSLSILGSSLFTVPGSILEAIDRLGEVLEAVRRMPSDAPLPELAEAAAGSLAVLLREGVLRRLVDARFAVKGIPAAGRFGKPVR